MFFSPRHVLFDDGVYGATVLAMRHGARPFHEVFSPQGPLHLPILYAGDLLGFRTLNAPRVAPVLAGIAVTLAVWAAGRRLGASRWGAGLAGGLAATTGTMLWTTGPITGDGIAVAFAAIAAWLALTYRDRPTIVRAIATGTRDGRRAHGQGARRSGRAARRAGGCGARVASGTSSSRSPPRSRSGSPSPCRGASGPSTTSR